jgi:hypothetical protein
MKQIDFPIMTDQQLQEMTGKSWQEWGELLDAWGGRTKSLSAIAAYLIERHHLRRLWAQMIAVYYKWNWSARQPTEG